MRNNWTNKEISFLIENYKKLSYDEISKKLNRGYREVTNKASKLHLRKTDKWDSVEVAYILENYMKLSYNEIAQHLKRSESSVANKAFKLGLIKDESKSKDRGSQIVKSVICEENTLCWSCRLATNIPNRNGKRCPWADKLKNVEGWETKKIICSGSELFEVVRCPLYEKG